MDESVLKGFGVSSTLLAGYLFVRCSPYRRFRTEHLRTDRFALHVLTCALVIYGFCVAGVSVLELDYRDSFAYSVVAAAATYTKLQGPVICALALAPILGWLDQVLILLRWSRDPSVMQKSWKQPITKIRTAAIAKFVTKCDDPGVRLLHRAIVYRKPLLITLSSGKVYIGEPVGGLGDPTVQAQSIKLIPRLSGYRKSETHKVEITTRYTDLREHMVLRNNAEPSNPNDPLAQDIADLTVTGGTVEVDIQDMGIVIMWSEIQTISLYDPNIYQAFQDKGPSPKSFSIFGKGGILTTLLFGE